MDPGHIFRQDILSNFRNFNFSKLNFNDKYPFIYQYTARQFLDQSLNTRADSLSNFNRKIVGKYKAGLGLRYLADYIGDTIISASFFMNGIILILN